MDNTISEPFSISKKEGFSKHLEGASKNGLDFMWQVEFKDKILNQYEEDGSENLAKEIFEREDDILKVHLISADKTYTYTKRPDDRLILVRRNYIHKSEKGTKKETVYMLGYQQTVDGKNVKEILFITKDGVKKSDNFNYDFV